jgi:hypothetical protein
MTPFATVEVKLRTRSYRNGIGGRGTETNSESVSVSAAPCGSTCLGT